jgi:hypothetical protein
MARRHGLVTTTTGRILLACAVAAILVIGIVLAVHDDGLPANCRMAGGVQQCEDPSPPLTDPWSGGEVSPRDGRLGGLG